MAAYWAFLVEKDPGIFGEGRIAVRAKLASLATNRIPVSVFKSEDAWKEYLNGKRVQEKERPLSAFRRFGAKKVPAGVPSPFKPSFPRRRKAFSTV